MLTKEAKDELTKQQYRIIGDHSAVKICRWTKNMLTKKGGCYKLKFYGIQSHQCMQMTTSISCANRCVFCWRGYKAPVSKEWKWEIDDPEMIIKGSLEQHRKLLEGYGGNEKASKKAYEQSKHVQHVALSLTGEPITYPRMNEMIKLFDQRGISTFMVTNAQYPEQIRDLLPVTQLYVSLDAPTKNLLKKVDVPLFSDYYERLLLSLDYLAKKKQRTCIRLTMIRDINMGEHERYAELINRGSPDFIEIKAYMFVGSSRERLEMSNMPTHKEVISFSKELLEHLPWYDYVTDHVPSRVCLLAKKTLKRNGKWHTWIDFPRYQELALAGKEFLTEDYLKQTPGETNE
ncbi:4-demethylwyosine synthase TYW1 [Candidatus Woesearchaeota archaeon]|nr:MAG: tRNA wybutosine-synthesizing protein 1 [archaeon GW2011_AR4]MBS3129743.1 4-demethylwyosine synthase TYW1 [Candidatus Woesearchaeota archaeon]HIH37435.1 4-demethylwyosine synthase TYW1 [Candidatus Woesearchaeota archaeon]HIJ02876.1 4-demethylwyosine synthase TYW1 [Candidatus Woesearchaeota archaeon]